MPKRALPAEDKEKLTRALSVRGASERAVHSIFNICREEEHTPLSRGAFRKVVEDKYDCWKQIIQPVKFECSDGSFVEIPITRLSKVLPKMCANAPAFRSVLGRALEGGQCLNPVFYCDESTAGNVLAVDKGRKACLFYMSWLQCWHLLKSPSMWICLCVVQSQCLQKIKGGVSKVMTELLKLTVTDDMERGIAVTDNLAFKQCQQAFFVGDHDAVRQVYSLKGSAGLRPCVLCDNVVKLNTSIVSVDSFFCEIGAAEGFIANTDEKIFAQCETLRACHQRNVLEVKEKCSGITYDPNTLMFNETERLKMPPSRILFHMHTNLFNGVAAHEIALFLDLCYSHTPMTRQILQDTMLDHDWRGLRRGGKTKTYLKNLMSEKIFGEGPIFKGQAHQVSALLPLIRYYLEENIEPCGKVPRDAVRSLETVSNIMNLIREIQHGLFPVDAISMRELDSYQRQHQDLFKIYGVGHKPKHHFRMHLPSQYLKAGLIISCEPHEAKHQLYKGGIAERQKGTTKNFEAFSEGTLVRVLQTSLDIIQEHGLPFWELLPPIMEAELEDMIQLATTTLTTSQSCFL